MLDRAYSFFACCKSRAAPRGLGVRGPGYCKGTVWLAYTYLGDLDWSYVFLVEVGAVFVEFLFQVGFGKVRESRIFVREVPDAQVGQGFSSVRAARFRVASALFAGVRFKFWGFLVVWSVAVFALGPRVPMFLDCVWVVESCDWVAAVLTDFSAKAPTFAAVSTFTAGMAVGMAVAMVIAVTWGVAVGAGLEPGVAIGTADGIVVPAVVEVDVVRMVIITVVIAFDYVVRVAQDLVAVGQAF